MNRLYFGDNLARLRNTKEFPNANVDLVISTRRLPQAARRTASFYENGG